MNDDAHPDDSADRIRARLTQRLAEARERTDALFARLPAAAWYERPIAERHRIVFYVGHLEAFEWNLLAAPTEGPATADAALDRLFAFGIDPVGTGLPQDQPGDWPALDVLLGYRDAVRRRLDDWLATLPMQRPGPWTGDGTFAGPFDGACLLSAVIEHRLMHAETLAYMLHRLPVGSLLPAGSPSPPLADGPSPVPAQAWVELPAGRVTLGLPRTPASTFGWDNEYPAQAVAVPAFAIQQHMVSNGEYLRFVQAGGYEDKALWRDDDWVWKTTQAVQHPAFWLREPYSGQWRLRRMDDEVALPLDGPVYVSQAEASAYARWAGLALPTEAQWQRAAEGVPQRTLRIGDHYDEALGPDDGLFDFRSWDPEPVHARRNVSAAGVVGLYGNGWEWTCTPFAPLTPLEPAGPPGQDGFEAFDFYRGYSRDFFDGRHWVLKGGSPRTAACMLRPSFRNWFQPHYPHVYAGFRCVAPTPLIDYRS